MIKLIIFDWDDVFSQGSTAGYYVCYTAAVKGVGIELSTEEIDRRIKRQWGKGHRQEIEELLKDNPELVDQACEIYERDFFGGVFVGQLSVIPGGAEFIDRIAQNYTLAIASGAHPTILKEQVMPKFGIDPDDFAMILTAYDLDDPQKAKPHPHSALKIMETLHVSPEEAIMVGDAKNDVLMARAAGIEPVVVLTGHLSRSEAEELQVRNIIDDVTQLESVLSKL